MSNKQRAFVAVGNDMSWESLNTLMIMGYRNVKQLGPNTTHACFKIPNFEMYFTISSETCSDHGNIIGVIQAPVRYTYDERNIVQKENNRYIDPISPDKNMFLYQRIPIINNHAQLCGRAEMIYKITSPMESVTNFINSYKNDKLLTYEACDDLFNTSPITATLLVQEIREQQYRLCSLPTYKLSDNQIFELFAWLTHQLGKDVAGVIYTFVMQVDDTTELPIIEPETIEYITLK